MKKHSGLKRILAVCLSLAMTLTLLPGTVWAAGSDGSRSIGFERIVTILLDQKFQVPTEGSKVAYLFEKGLDSKRLGDVINEAMRARSEGIQVLVAQMNKNKKFQKEQLAKDGYTEIREFYREALK